MRFTTVLILLFFSGGLTHAERPQQTKPDTRQFEPSKPEPRKFPRHWGHPPEIQTRDMVKLPGKFGMGSSTLASWIRENLKKDANKEKPETGKPKPRPKPPIKPIRPKRPEPSVDVKERIAVVMEKEKERIEIGRAHVELQSHSDLVCRLLLEKKNKNTQKKQTYDGV